MVTPALSCASSVDAPRCGDTTTLGSSKSGDSVHGSLAKTSSPAPATMPSRMASASASSSTIPPRAVLMMRMPGLALANRSRPNKPRSRASSGVWMETKSASATSSSMPTSSHPHGPGPLRETKGSYPMSSMPKACARWATSEPARPSPTTPSTLPCSSTPSHFERSQRPATSAASAWGMLRACASSSAMACSATERMFDVGALTTMTPRSVAAVDVDVVEADARPADNLQRRCRPPAPRRVTWVAERMMSACAPTMAPSSSSGLSPSWTSTSWPASASRSSPLCAIFSVTSTRATAVVSLLPPPVWCFSLAPRRTVRPTGTRPRPGRGPPWRRTCGRSPARRTPLRAPPPPWPR